MTRTEMQVLREDVAGGLNHLALLRIDAELAKPEEREWRVKWDMRYRILNLRAPQEQIFLSEKAAHSLAKWCKDDDSYRNILIEYRTPAGPWERAE